MNPRLNKNYPPYIQGCVFNKCHILIANGGMMKCGGHCENVKLQMGDYHLKTRMFAINMCGCDTLFRCRMDMHSGADHHVISRGIHELC